VGGFSSLAVVGYREARQFEGKSKLQWQQQSSVAVPSGDKT